MRSANRKRWYVPMSQLKQSEIKNFLKDFQSFVIDIDELTQYWLHHVSTGKLHLILILYCGLEQQKLLVLCWYIPLILFVLSCMLLYVYRFPGEMC